MNAHHQRPPVHSARPPKRRRHFPPAPSSPDAMEISSPTPSPLRLQHLPLEALKLILSHLFLPYRTPSAPSTAPLPFLRDHYPLRTLCTLFRDAIDSTVTSLALSTLPTPSHPAFLHRVMPHFTSLTSLTLCANSLCPTLLPSWRSFFSSSRSRISSLTFVPPSTPSPLPDLFAAALHTSLDSLSTTSGPLLASLARHRAPLTSLELLMDDLDPALLPSFAQLRLAKLLYRSRLSHASAQRLVASLALCSPELHSVELRLNHLRTSALSTFVTEVRRLRKLSLFDGEVDADGGGMDALGKCAFLEEVQLEWMKGLRGEHVARLAEVMGPRLRRLRIWNCEDVDNQGLEAVARCCPDVEVELRFEREQFRQSTLAMFGERVSWGSYAL